MNEEKKTSVKPPLDRLTRFIYLNTEKPRFISGNPEVHNKFLPNEVTFNNEINSSECQKVPVLIQSLSKKNIPYKEAVFFALVSLIRSRTAEKFNPHDLYTAVLNQFDCNEDLFSFVKCYRAQAKNVPSGLKKIIAAYYFRKEPMELVKTVTESNSYHGWSHKDLFKLIHYKTDNILFDLIIKYVLFGMERALSSSGGTKEENEILDYLKKIETFKRSEDEQFAIECFNELEISKVKQLPGKLNKSYIVWEALIPRLSLSELIQNLPKLYKMGFLKQGTLHDKVIEILLDKKRIEASKIQPIEVFIGLKNLEKGGKPKDPNLIKYLLSKEDIEMKEKLDKKPNFAHQEPAKCAQVISALQKAFQTSLLNLCPMSRNVMITVEIQDKMNEPCLTTKNVTRIEAAALVILCMIKMTRNYTVGVFNGNGISTMQFEKNASIGQIIKKLKEAHHGQANFNTPFDWAKKNKKSIDFFINIFMTSTFCVVPDQDQRLKTGYENYCKELKLHDIRVIQFAPASHRLDYASSVADSKPYLDVCGFDVNTMKVIDGFMNYLF
ncbi:RNA-binding protein RO60 [Onthophagus taurus]|uniref:RNA-binding protein RO60 n=1 Tax=Onthophagus taurus TaxID=166361 RepID=UPI0039BE9E24